MSATTTATPPAYVKTRFLILSDTHSATPSQNSSNQEACFRPPLPKADVLLHCGDLTMVGHLNEYEKTLDMLSSIEADLKLVIAGNHDITLDEAYYARKGPNMHFGDGYDADLPKKALAMWTGERAKKAGVIYLTEGTHTFKLPNGANLRVYASPYQPEFCDWAFPYFRNQDRYNPPHQCTPNAVPIADNPVPDFPAVDVMMTHGPPMHVLDAINTGEHVGCEHLLRAAWRCKPRLHCFGHIHEGWGAQRVKWSGSEEIAGGIEECIEGIEPVLVGEESMVEERAAKVDVSRGAENAVEFGKETLMVNASIMTVWHKPQNAPWLVDMDLDLAK